MYGVKYILAHIEFTLYFWKKKIMYVCLYVCMYEFFRVDGARQSGKTDHLEEGYFDYKPPLFPPPIYIYIYIYVYMRRYIEIPWLVFGGAFKPLGVMGSLVTGVTSM